jgi:hypothetical protein
MLLKVDSFEESIDKDRVESDNYLDYLENTQSEGDFNNFIYLSMKTLLLISTITT